MNYIPLSVPNISEDDIAEVVKVLRSGMLVQGINVSELEANICSLTRCGYASAVSNGTASLHLSLLACGIGPGDEVIMPAFSYNATANSVELTGATPIFVDIDADTFNIDPLLIEQAITKKTRAIMPVHEFGLAADMDPIMVIAEKHNLFVIEDAACALGAQYNGKSVGTFGTFGSFSLHPRKAVSSGEGGLIVTQDEKLDQKVKVLRNHGISMKMGHMDFVDIGYNYRMTDFQAALVKNQVLKLDKIIKYRRELASIYLNEITNPLIKLPSDTAKALHTWQTFHVVVDEDIDRDKLIEDFKDRGIGTNYGAQCMPATTVYQQKYRLDCKSLFPNSMKAYKKGLALPLYEKLTKEQVMFVSKEVKKILHSVSQEAN